MICNLGDPMSLRHPVVLGTHSTRTKFWKCCTPKIEQIQTLKVLGTNSTRTILWNLYLCLAIPRNINFSICVFRRRRISEVKHFQEFAMGYSSENASRNAWAAFSEEYILLHKNEGRWQCVKHFQRNTSYCKLRNISSCTTYYRALSEIYPIAQKWESLKMREAFSEEYILLQTPFLSHTPPLTHPHPHIYLLFSGASSHPLTNSSSCVCMYVCQSVEMCDIFTDISKCV